MYFRVEIEKYDTFLPPSKDWRKTKKRRQEDKTDKSTGNENMKKVERTIFNFYIE